jgi:hypothetical protein
MPVFRVFLVRKTAFEAKNWVFEPKKWLLGRVFRIKNQ